MDLGLGKKREERMQQDMLSQEMKHDRDMSALQQAGQGFDQSMSPDLIKWEHEFLDEFNKSILILQSKERIVDEDGNVSYRPMRGEYLGKRNINGVEKDCYKPLPPIMNGRGISAWRIFTAPMLSRNLLMSNLTEEQILRKLKNTTIDLIMQFGSNHILYDLDKNNLTMLVRLFKSTVEPTCFRCLNSGERAFLSSSTKRLEAISLSEGSNPQSKKGLLQGLMG